MAFEVNITGAVITLKNSSTNAFAEIYSYGALLNAFSVQQGELSINVIDGFSSITEATEKLTPFFKSAKLSPFVCRVKNARYQFGENSYELSKYSSRGHALHGLLFNVSYSISQYEGNESSARVKLEYEYDNQNEGYPFRYKCEIEYTLSAENTLTVSTTITNNDEQLIPVTDGWHPYFTLGDTIDSYQLEFQSKEMLDFDEDLIPTGERVAYQDFGSLKNFGPTQFDNCFTLNFAECQPMCVVRNPAKKIQLEIHPDPSYPYLQMYTPDHRKSIAIENLSAAPDAFNNGMGLRVLSPGETATFLTKFVIRSL
jgi:aldose 1-epimerase